MSARMKLIENYGISIDFDISPFEAMDMLHQRSNLEKVIEELTHEEMIKLLNYDIKLINNAKKMTEHISEIYNFSTSAEPLNYWWWHLDKVADGSINFKLKNSLIQ